MMMCKFDIANMQPYIYCKVVEDNTLELARLLRLCFCTEHINMCYHHFASMSGKHNQDLYH